MRISIRKNAFIQIFGGTEIKKYKERKMKLKKFFSLVLAGVLAFSVAGCADDGKAVSVDDLFVPTYEDAGEIVLRTDLPPNQ